MIVFPRRRAVRRGDQVHREELGQRLGVKAIALAGRFRDVPKLLG
jgi:hypothetical protein